MAQKFEETKTTTKDDTSDNANDQNCSDFNQNFPKAVTVDPNDRDRKQNFKNSASSDNNRNGIEKNDKKIDDIEDNSNKDALITDKMSSAPTAANLEERIKMFLKSKASSSQATVSSESASAQPETSQTKNSRNGGGKSKDDFEDEYTEHLYPNKIDISTVTGEIIQVSTFYKCVH